MERLLEIRRQGFSIRAQDSDTCLNLPLYFFVKNFRRKYEKNIIFFQHQRKMT